eukprot:augustus_masked-scaffold_9-processed-gene-7.11-mRNA-1 protein AED:0.03 eAED:0.03 QI:0/-1/0/1/-1/1/1/0/721
MSSEVSYTAQGDLKVHPVLHTTVTNEICSDSPITASKFYSTLETLLNEFSNRNSALLRKRDALQAQIDAYHLETESQPFDMAKYAAFLAQIGYLVPEGPDFSLSTENVDPEIATVSAPQLVVPVDKARFALNAANARWGSLLDAFYGTDAGPPQTAGLEKGSGYNPKRGDAVFAMAHDLLDKYYPLQNGEWKDLEAIDAGIKLKNPKQLVGIKEGGVLLVHNDLHTEIVINPAGNAGKHHKAGVNDIIFEAAATAIADFEDSVAAVDAFDKSVIYKNWAGLMKGTLEETFSKNGKTLTRKLNADREWFKPGTQEKFTLPGRVVFLVRNVGLHMYNDMVLYKNQPVPEGFVDLVVTAACAFHDFRSGKELLNSRTGSVYIVKPKQHGPEEVAFTVSMFSRVEELLDLPENCLKIGIMDEERRTTVNLKECIRAAKERCIFINTGFMDRTGDEFHTSMRLGVFETRVGVKKAKWLPAYEAWNVDVGIKCGLKGKAQIGKGMWAEPDAMKNMLATKISHLEQGATCAWVPSPTAATIHALHYHELYVPDVLSKIGDEIKKTGGRGKLEDILTPPLLEFSNRNFSAAEVAKQLDDNAQSILGYVVRWVIMGVGCSKVPDINNVALMEDRATLRINSQHLGNWLLHGVVTEEQIIESFQRMAKIVDEQNKGQAGYKPMVGNFETNNGYLCALELVFNSLKVENGLTEYSLTKFRRAEKALQRSAKL